MWDLIINIIGLAGIVCLAIPAWDVNKYGRLLARLSQAQTGYTDQTIQQMREQVRNSLEQIRNRWTAWKSNLLIIGTILAGASYVIAAIKAGVECLS